jgi:phosphotransferase system enzyme I (PtsP)
MTLDNQSILLSQYKAMLRASVGLDNLNIMIPMVTSVDEVMDAKRILDDAYQEVLDEIKCEGKTLKYPKFGVMIEVPSMLFILEDVAPLVDFFSIGTNDLTQYMLAVDRSNSRVSHIYTPYHPAVLRVLREIGRKISELGSKVDVCGEMCGGVMGMVILLAFGYRIFSMNLSSIAKIKYVIRRIDISQITRIVEENDLKDIEALKARLSDYISGLDLQRFVSE